MSVNCVPDEHIKPPYTPEPPLGRAMGARTAMRIPKAMDTKLRAIAEKDGVLISAVVRCALDAYIRYRSTQL